MIPIIFLVFVFYSIACDDVVYIDLSEINPTQTALILGNQRQTRSYRGFPEPETTLEKYDFPSRSQNIRYDDRYWEVPLEDQSEEISLPQRPNFKTKNRKRSFNTEIQNDKPDRNPTINVTDILKRYINTLYSHKNMKTTTDRPKQDDFESSGKFFDQPLEALKNKTFKLANKFLSLFTVVQFSNSKCQAISGTSEYEGTCYHQSECDDMNGTGLGDCASGYGVCCVFKYNCGGTSSQNCSYFESPGYPNYYPPGGGTLPPTAPPPQTPSPDPTPDPRKDFFYHHLQRTFKQDSSADSLICDFMIYRQSNDIQQLRIDFIDLELKGPTNGECVEERLVITGQNLNDAVPVICGYNSGGHIYVDVSTLTGPLQISVLSSTVSSKRFKIRICQFSMGCSNSMNCLQYYTGPQGIISSFNYDQSVVYPRSTPGYFNNLNYAICIRKEAGFCSVTYRSIQNNVEYPFQLLNVDDAGEYTVPRGQAGVDIISCPSDFIVINGVRLCGEKLNDGLLEEDLTKNAPVTDASAGPIIVQVRTDELLSGRGFKLFYTQNPCTRY